MNKDKRLVRMQRSRGGSACWHGGMSRWGDGSASLWAPRTARAGERVGWTAPVLALPLLFPGQTSSQRLCFLFSNNQAGCGKQKRKHVYRNAGLTASSCESATFRVRQEGLPGTCVLAIPEVSLPIRAKDLAKIGVDLPERPVLMLLHICGSSSLCAVGLRR